MVAGMNPDIVMSIVPDLILFLLSDVLKVQLTCITTEGDLGLSSAGPGERHLGRRFGRKSGGP